MIIKWAALALSSLLKINLVHPSDSAFEKKWIEFSKIQCAEYLTVDIESIERFYRWQESGIDDDAWS